MVQVAGSGTVATDNAVEMATALPSGFEVFHSVEG